MIILATGDWHIHNYPQFAKPWREGLNSRVKHIVESLSAIPQVIGKYSVDVFCHLGDWNFNPSNDYRLVNITKKAMDDCLGGMMDAGKPIQVSYVHGNHDTVSGAADNHNNYPYIEATPNFIHRGVRFYSLGYNDPLPDPAKLARSNNCNFSVFLIHKDIIGGQSSKGFIYKSTGVNREYFDAVKKALFGNVLFLAGHYHKPQTIGDVIVVGAPVQHNRADIGQKRGVLLFDTETRKMQRIALPGPKFYEYAWPDVESEDLTKFTERDYLSIVVESSGADYAAARAWLKGTKLNAAVVVKKKEDQQTQIKKESLSVLGEEQLLRKYLTERENLSGHDLKEALSIAKTINI